MLALRALPLPAPLALLALLALLAALPAGAQEVSLPPPPGERQALDDAWWTGPMLANTAATPVPGHLLVETYLYDVSGDARFDSRGNRHGAAASNGYGSLTYLVYGPMERVALGLVPTVGFDTVAGAKPSAGPRVGDLTLLAQYRLTLFRQGSWVPTTSVDVQETLPTGMYDRLGSRPTDGLGGGVYTTTLSLYSQTYLWLPNGRILRLRLDLSQAFSTRTEVDGVSVYGTPSGFHGRADPGGSFTIDASGEYSLTRGWVLASDVVYRHAGSIRVAGADPPPAGGVPIPLQLASGASDALAVAPAIEYSWRPDLGVLVGVRVIAAGRNTSASLTPAVAINYVH